MVVASRGQCGGHRCGPGSEMSEDTTETRSCRSQDQVTERMQEVTKDDETPLPGQGKSREYN